MPLRNPADLAALNGPGERFLGLDIGTKTVGLALSDVMRVIATPTETLRRGKFGDDAKKLFDMVQKHDVAALVLGLPMNMDGSEGPRCQSVRQFAANMLAHFEKQGQDIDIVFWDERLSTVTAHRVMIDADLSRKRQAEVVDKMAAAVILQGYLDFLSYAKRNAP
jgi:putative Holliday junction resolvase